jgi:bifunctional non-homologous end joining protein LigD
VVQRHRARRLHYDFRLELDGVLLSWSVPKGPTLDPAAKRLAVRTEDHPIEYLEFEGVIPAGDYGGGDVIVWDLGTWEPAEGKNPVRMLGRGDLHFDLYGQKLRGRFALVRGQGGGGPKTEWLLIHKRDDHAVSGWRVEDHDRSVLSGLTNDQVANAPAATWSSSAPATDAEVRTSTIPPEELAPVRAVTAGELEAFDGVKGAGAWEVQGRELRLTKLDRVLAPGVTKRDLLRYLARVGPHLVPFLRGRPLVRRRHRAGPGDSPWTHTLPARAPDWFPRWTVGGRDHPVVDDVPSLLWLGNEGMIELHPWLSRVADPDEPTWAVVDIDPGTRTTWDDTLTLARLFRTALDHLGVAAAPKVSGQRGIHIWIPVGPGCAFAATQQWVEELSRAVGAVVPDLVSWRWRKDERRGRARLDYTQNARSRTMVAPWSPRIAPGLPVSVPITWDELDDPDLRPDRWTLGDVDERLDRPDPLGHLLGRPQSLPPLAAQESARGVDSGPARS